MDLCIACCCDAGDLMCVVLDDPGDLFGVDVWTMLTTDVFLLVQPINIWLWLRHEIVIKQY